MTSVRGVTDRRYKFVQILNSMFEDPNLSLKAKGFIGYCLTKKEDWDFHVFHLCSVLKEGEKAIYSTINECIENGYACRFQPRLENGQAGPVEYIISDSKHEIEAIKKEREENPELKKCLPEPQNRQAVERQPQNRQAVFPGKSGPIYSNTDSSNTEEQQQQHAAAFSDSQKLGQQKPKIYKFLDGVDVPDVDKMEITQRYSEDIALNAVKWAVHPQTKINKTLVQAIKWACQNKPEVPKNQYDEIDANKKYAKRYDDMQSNSARITVLSEGVEITNFGVNPSAFIRYDDKGFMDQLHNHLRKNNIQILG